MNKSVFGLVVVVCVAGAIVYGVATGEVTSGWFWPHVGLNLVWGGIGLAVAALLTFPILRRRDVAFWLVLAGTPLVVLVAGLPAMGYQDLQLYRDGVEQLDAGGLDDVSADRPIIAELSGVWRYDLAVVGTYVAGRGGSIEGRCSVYEMHACRVPIVSESWKTGDPVLAISSDCTGRGRPAHRSNVSVKLAPAAHPHEELFDFERVDGEGRTVYHGLCGLAPADQHASLAGAGFHFDQALGFLVVPRPESLYDVLSIAIIESLFVVAALVFVLRPSYRRARVLKRHELAARASVRP